MAEIDINRSCVIAQDRTGKLHIIEVEDIPTDEDPFAGMDTGPSKESIERARALWEAYQRLNSRSDDDAA